MYDEMAIVVGKDMASGSFTDCFEKIDLDGSEGSNLKRKSKEFDDEEDFVDDNEEVKASSVTGSSKRRRKKKEVSANDDQIQFVGEQLGEIAKALGKFNEDKLVISHLYGEVMSMEKEGFDDKQLVAAFDFLGENEKQAKLFLAKSEKHRKIWLENFTQG